MNDIITTINLSFDPSANETPQRIASKQFDNLSRIISVKLIDVGAISEKLENASVVLRGTKPDSSVFDVVGIRKDGYPIGQYDFPLAENALSVSGSIKCDVLCTWEEEDNTISCSTELFFIDNISSAIELNSSKTPAELQTLSAQIRKALAKAQEEGLFNGKQGKSAFDIAVENGFGGNEEEWLESLKCESNNEITSQSVWSGKKLIAFGTSITANGNDYLKTVANRNGFADFTNAGVSGAAMANNTKNGAGVNYKIKNTPELADSDLILIECATNDFKLDVPLGSVGLMGDTDFDTESFCGALRGSIEFILKTYPEKQILIITDPQRNKDGFDVNHANAQGLKLIDYVDAAIEIAALYGLPVCDWYRSSGFNALTLGKFTSDGLHPNALGYKALGNLTAACVARIYSIFDACAIENDNTENEGGNEGDLGGDVGGGDSYPNYVDVDTEYSVGILYGTGETDTISTYKNWRITDFIPVSPGETYRYVGKTDLGTLSIISVGGYDGAQKFKGAIIKKADNLSGKMFLIPDGMHYIRCCFYVNETEYKLQKATY